MINGFYWFMITGKFLDSLGINWLFSIQINTETFYSYQDLLFVAQICLQTVSFSMGRGAQTFVNIKPFFCNFMFETSCRDSWNINIKEELIRISSYLVKETWHEPGVGISEISMFVAIFFLQGWLWNFSDSVETRFSIALHCWLNSTKQEARSPENPEALKLNLFTFLKCKLRDRYWILNFLGV